MIVESLGEVEVADGTLASPALKKQESGRKKKKQKTTTAASVAAPVSPVDGNFSFPWVCRYVYFYLFVRILVSRWTVC